MVSCSLCVKKHVNVNVSCAHEKLRETFTFSLLPPCPFRGSIWNTYKSHTLVQNKWSYYFPNTPARFDSEGQCKNEQQRQKGSSVDEANSSLACICMDNSLHASSLDVPFLFVILIYLLSLVESSFHCCSKLVGCICNNNSIICHSTFRATKLDFD